MKLAKIGFVVKHHDPRAAAFAVDLGRFVFSQGFQAAFADEGGSVAKALSSELKRRVINVSKEKLVGLCDLIVVLGGDGTFLSIARLIGTRNVPVMGINMGKLGFLTEIKQSEAIEVLGQLMRGKKPHISERALLDVTLRRKNKTIFKGPVVNDAVISKGAIARIIGLQVAVDGRWVHDVRADGLIVSTPTGSTAYSLAAGGPIIEPSLGALVLTPICPHSLTQRPLVLSDRSEIQICLRERPGHVMLTLDGQDVIDMNQGDLVVVRRFQKHPLRLISSPTRDYFSLLREKFQFGMRN